MSYYVKNLAHEHRLTKTLLLLSLLAVACTKIPSPDPVPVPSDVPVEFGVTDGLSKGQDPIVSLQALAAVDFGVSAWFTPRGEEFGDTSVEYFQNHRFGYITPNLAAESTFPNPWQGVAAHAAGTGAVTPAPVYWPLDGTLTFFCYAPYRTDAVLDTPPAPDARDIVLEAAPADMQDRHPDYLAGSPIIRYTPAASAADQIDFLAAPAILDRRRSENEGRFPVDFSRHRLTRLDFRFNYDDVYEDDEHNVFHYLAAGESVRVLSVAVRGVIGSKYLYFTGGAPYATECAWSDAVSPVDKEAAGAALPLADYRLNAVKAGTGELGYGYEYELPEKNGSNDNHKPVVREKGRLYLLPQELPADAVLEITYAIYDGTNYKGISEIISVPLKANLAEWEQGTRVCYRITLNLKPHQSASCSVLTEKWMSSENDQSEIELLPNHD